MAKKPDAGDLFYRIHAQARSTIDDGYGNEISGPFETKFTVRAAYRHLRGGETVMAARLENKHPMVVSVRSSSQTRQITTDWQIVDARNGEIYAVRDVTHETDRQWVSLLVESGSAS